MGTVPRVRTATVDFLENTDEFDREDAKKAIKGNVCRCTGYEKILDAIETLDEETDADRDSPSAQSNRTLGTTASQSISWWSLRPIAMANQPSFGIVLPHFGPHCNRDFIVDTAKQAETLGFDSVWARDHLYVPPENKEHGGIVEQRFAEAMQVLSHLAAVTDDLTLATGSLNPHRHPLKLSQCIGSLEYLSTGDVLCAIGAGTFKGEFDAVDLPFDERGRLVEENLEILRRTFREENVDYEGDHFAFENVTIDPRPGDSVPLWYGGLSPFAVRRAVEYADGWYPGRMTLEKLDQRLEQLHSLEAEHDRSLDLGYLSIYSVAPETDEAISHLNTEELVHDVNTILRTDHSSLDDIEGSYIAGDPETCIEQIQALVDRGFDHIVLDMRNSFDELESMMELTADEVLPAFR